MDDNEAASMGGLFRSISAVDGLSGAPIDRDAVLRPSQTPGLPGMKVGSVWSISVPMETNDNIGPEDPTCPSCGRKLTLVSSLPKIDDRPRTRLYKCIPCQNVVSIPPRI